MSGNLGMLQGTPESGFQWASPDAGMTLRGNKTLRSPYPAESRPIPETQSPRVGPDDETVAPDGSDSPSPPPIATTAQWKFPSMTAHHKRQIMQVLVPLVQLRRAHVPIHGEGLNIWGDIFSHCKKNHGHLFGGLNGKPVNSGQTLRRAFESYITAWSSANKRGEKQSGISEVFGGLESDLSTLQGEIEAAKGESQKKTAEKKQKAEEEKADVEVAKRLRDVAVGRANPAVLDEDANPFLSRRATEVREQIEAANGDAVEAGTRMANTVSAPKNVRGPGKKRKSDTPDIMAAISDMSEKKMESDALEREQRLKMHQEKMEFEREKEQRDSRLAMYRAETERKAQENRAEELALAKMRLQLEMQQMEHQRMMTRKES